MELSCLYRADSEALFEAALGCSNGMFVWQKLICIICRCYLDMHILSEQIFGAIAWSSCSALIPSNSASYVVYVIVINMRGFHFGRDTTNIFL